MKVVLLAGGFGTRISEYTQTLPKPMIPIGGKPILWHIMQYYAHYGHKDFYVALGYKSEVIKEYFLNYSTLDSDFTVHLETGKVTCHRPARLDWNVTLVNTGIDTMTGGRLLRLKEFIGNETFMLTYGDGLSNINIDSLLDFHRNHGKLITISAVHPSARFGELELHNDSVSSFKEKPQLEQGWINGGFFVVEPEFLDLIDGDHTLLEREPLELAVSMGQLMAFRHQGFWQCMDTKRDHEILENLWTLSPPWVVQ